MLYILQSLCYYNQAADSLEGTENLGEFGKCSNLANFTLVFMVKGLISKWRKVLGHFQFNGSISSKTLMKMVEKAATKVQETGFIVNFLVCDQDPVHRSVYKGLGVTKVSFFCEWSRSTFFYDTPHLLKSIRNNLRKYTNWNRNCFLEVYQKIL